MQYTNDCKMYNENVYKIIASSMSCFMLYVIDLQSNTNNRLTDMNRIRIKK